MSEHPSDETANGSDVEQLDFTWLYYQTPAGKASAAPITLRQLCKLLVPAREGLNPVLQSRTQCLVVGREPQEWQSASQLRVAREASAQWYLNNAPQVPCSCRSLVGKFQTNENGVLVYAQGITDEWRKISDLPDLQLALQAITPSDPPPESRTSNGEDVEEESDQQYESVEVQDELEAFLSSTAGDMEDEDEKDHSYESDGGTRYVKDGMTGNWIHEALAPKPEKPQKSQALNTSQQTKTSKAGEKKPRKAKFLKKNAKNWIYISGLPDKNVTVEALHKYFGRCGLIDLDPETLQPKIKVYTNENGKLKGDASICYARGESVDLALQVLDESPWDETHTLKVERAKFEAKQGQPETNKRKRTVSQAKRKVAKLALLQARDEGFGGRLAGGRQGLRIVVVKQMMDGIPENRLETAIQEYCAPFGAVEKITCVEKTKVVIVKFVEPSAASTAVQEWNGMVNTYTKQSMEAIYWDGVTDHTHKEENPEEEEKRHEDFGKWLDSQKEDLPAEFRLEVAED